MTQSATFPEIPALSDPLIAKVGARLRAVLQAGDGAVVLALSGGPDSCALLACLKAFAASRTDLLVHACHINHGLRGAESDQDEEFVRQLCHHWQVPLHVERLDGTVRSEDGLRNARYAALAVHAQQVGARYVLTGHNQDDQIETVVFRLFRGTSPAGLVGIAEQRRLDLQVTLVRPMLTCSRQEIVAFLARIGLSARLDSSNESSEYSRNYIRNVVLPLIKERFPTFDRSIERTRLLIEENEKFLDELAGVAKSSVSKSENTWCLEEFLHQPLPIRRRLVAEALQDRNVEVSFERTNAILSLAQEGSGRLSLDRYWDVQVTNDGLNWLFMPDCEEQSQEGQRMASPLQEELHIPGLTICSSLSVTVQAQVYAPAPGETTNFPAATADTALVDLSRCTLPLVVRIRQPGDAIRPFGMTELVKLKKYLHTHQSVGIVNQSRSLVVADADEVIWVPGVGLSEKVRVGEHPTHKLRFMHMSNNDLSDTGNADL